MTVLICVKPEEENEVDDFQNSKQRIDKFKENLFPKNVEEEEDDKNSFKNVILHEIRFHKEQKSDLFNFNEPHKVIDQDLINALNQEKYEFVIDLQKFQNIFYEINYLLSTYNFFLRVFELREKFRHLTLKDSKKQNVIRQPSSCITENITDSFQVIAVEYSKKVRKIFTPIDIIYSPIKNPDQKIYCYFTTEIAKAYQSSYNKDSSGKIERTYAFECDFKKTFVQSERQQKHMGKIIQKYRC